jgi:alkanesulfonate monooxygenase SsuD/methylene tetrahydromethanopterin reductase-like flavin-dependent oxidoreductase (luciferase family)
MPASYGSGGRSSNPLFNGNKLKLGLFGMNVSGGCTMTTDERALQLTWPNSVAICQAADRVGFEALVPPARWRGFGGVTNFNGESYETYTWAAGIGQATRQASIFATSHVPVIHPVMAAKEAATIDHITGGRFALNIVCGWFQAEMAMFGASLREHDERYDYAAEWIELVKLLWSREDQFDFDGKYFSVAKGFSQPKPIQKPFPPLMNAGGSGKGRHFAAKYADMAFVLLQSHDLEEARRQVDAYRALARGEYGRDLQIWSIAYVVQGETEREARDYLRHYAVEKGDDSAVESWMANLGTQTESIPQSMRETFKTHFKAGVGSFPLVGTADQIADRLGQLSKAGLDGVLLSWLDYAEGVVEWTAKVMPLLEQLDLRTPHREAVPA